MTRIQTGVRRVAFPHEVGGLPFERAESEDVGALVAVLDEDPEVWDNDDDGAAYIHLLMVGRAHAGVGLGDAAL